MYSMNEVSSFLGVSTSMLNKWERQGIISTDYISESNEKFYNESQIARLRHSGIQVLKKYKSG